MTGKSMIRLLMAGAGLALAIAAVACSGDDDDDGGNGASGGNGTPATATVTPLPTFGVPTETPGSGGAVPVESATPGIPQLPADSEPPGTSVTANGVSVEAGIGTFCWTMLCVDKIGVPTKGTLTVSNGDKVSFAIPYGVPPLREGVAAVFAATQPQLLDDSSEIWPYPGAPGEQVASVVTNESLDVTIELEPGRYVLSAFLAFEAGDVVYGVLIEVQ